uniref:Transmembrane protein 144 n=1 Tax=Globodera pallida TaxID=36090 RepID=A0A183C803_GLOPA
MDNPSSADLLIGYLSLSVSCLAFGFAFVPLKRYDTRDGLFVQWVQCSVVFMAGLIINIARGLPPFNLIAAVGGFLYATGNVASVPIVAEMGIGLGMLTWGSVQIIVGWSVARFGLFGTKAQHVQSPFFNSLGVLITLISGLMFVFVYSRQNVADEVEDGEGRAAQSNIVPLNSTNPPYGSVNSTTGERTATTVGAPGDNLASTDRQQKKWHFHVKSRKLLFVTLTVCLGVLHGLMLTPIVYVQDTDQRASKNALDFVFSHFCAVFFFSTFYFVLYSLFRRGRPYVNPSLVLPSVAYGLLWSLGMSLFIVSNRILSQPVSFPVTVRLPAIIGAVVDVFLFKDIRGRRRLAWLFAAIIVGSIGVILFIFGCDVSCFVQIHFCAKELIGEQHQPQLFQIVSRQPQFEHSERYHFPVGANQQFNHFTFKPHRYVMKMMHWDGGPFFPVVIEIRSVSDRYPEQVP